MDSEWRHSDEEKLYSTAELQRSQIRLLKLFPGRPDSELSGFLEVCDFSFNRSDQKPCYQYEALSYYWGKSSPRVAEHVMKIFHGENSYEINLRPNLESALRRLRYENKERRLWVDALCIYQKKHDPRAVQEKNFQLPRMHEIYNRAERVCVWLGPERDQSSNAMKFVKDIVDLERFNDFMNDDRQDAEEVAHFAKLLRRPWFNRRWIVQEIALARKAQIYCGPEELSWPEFQKAISLFSSRLVDVKRKFRASAKFGHSPDYLGDVKEYSAYQLVYAASNFFRKSDQGEILERLQNLEEVVSMLSTFEGYDPRDVIYAVVALSKDVKAKTRDKSDFAINTGKEDEFLDRHRSSNPVSPTLAQHPGLYQQLEYSHDGDGMDIDGTLHPTKAGVRQAFKRATRRFLKPLVDTVTIKTDADIFEVYKDFLQLAITHSRSIDILSRPWAVDVEGLPSWIQGQLNATHTLRNNRAYRRVKGDAFVGSPRSGGKIYNASGNLSLAWWSYEDRPKDGLSKSLIVQGFVLDEVDRICLPSYGFTIPPDWFKVWKKVAAPKNPSDAFWRTLVADRGSEGRKPLPQHYELAFEYLDKYQTPHGGLCFDDVSMEDENPPESKEFVDRMHAVVCMRRFAVSKNQIRIGLVPHKTKKGDKICILEGCSVPIILREKPTVTPQSALTALATEVSGKDSDMPSPARTFREVERSGQGGISPRTDQATHLTNDIRRTEKGPSKRMSEASLDGFWGSGYVPKRSRRGSRAPSISVTGIDDAQAQEVLDTRIESGDDDGTSAEVPTTTGPDPVPKINDHAVQAGNQFLPFGGPGSFGPSPMISRTPSWNLPKVFYKFIGECYIHGVMEGEAQREAYMREKQSFWLR